MKYTELQQKIIDIVSQEGRQIDLVDINQEIRGYCPSRILSCTDGLCIQGILKRNGFGVNSFYERVNPC